MKPDYGSLFTVLNAPLISTSPDAVTMLWDFMVINGFLLHRAILHSKQKEIVRKATHSYTLNFTHMPTI